MMGFSSCNNSDVFQWPKLVSIGRSCSEPFSRLQWTGAGLLLAGQLAMPTKTPFALSQFSGRLGSFLRVPLQVLSMSLPGRAWFWYLFQLVRIQSRLSLSFRVAIMQFCVSWGGGVLFRDSSFMLRSLLQQAFHSHRKVHSDAAIRKRQVEVPGNLPPSCTLFSMFLNQ